MTTNQEERQQKNIDAQNLTPEDEKRLIEAMQDMNQENDPLKKPQYKPYSVDNPAPDLSTSTNQDIHKDLDKKFPCENKKFRKDIKTLGMELPEDESCGCSNCEMKVWLRSHFIEKGEHQRILNSGRKMFEAGKEVMKEGLRKRLADYEQDELLTKSISDFLGDIKGIIK